jgi:hypothetical protein
MKKIFFPILAMFLAGCATWTFEPQRTARFVDEENNFITVDYGMDEKAHETVFTTDHGVRLPFKSKLKVRVELPDGTRFVAHQNMAIQGNLYVSKDGEWKFFESGMGCAVAKIAEDENGYVLVYRGTMCANLHNPFAEKRPTIRPGASTPRGFGRSSSGPRTVEQKND